MQTSIPLLSRLPGAAVAALMVLVVAGSAGAHPDVFMQSRVVLGFDDEGLVELRVELLFEKFFAQGIWAQCDQDKDGRLIGQELQIARDLTSTSDDLLGMLIYLWVDGKAVEIFKVSDVVFLQESDRLGVTFAAPCRVAAGETPSEVVVSIYDESCYVRITPAPTESFRLLGAGGLDVTVSPPVKSERVEVDPSGPMNPAYTMTEPMEVVVRFSRKATAATGPVTTVPASSPGGQVVSFGPKAPESITEYLLHYQQKARDWLADLNTDYHRSGAMRPILLMLVAAFGYGVLHAVGPGHGKSVAVSYLLSHGRTLRSGLLVGNLIPVFHTASGVIVSLGLHWLVDAAGRGQRTTAARQGGEAASYSLIALLGVILLVTHLRALRSKGHDDTERSLSRYFRSPVLLALAVGVFPCPITIIIMEVFINDAPLLGLLVVLFQAMGMAATITVVCLLAAWGRVSISRVTSRRANLSRRIMSALAIVGAAVVMLLGATFLYGALTRYYL